MVGSWVQGGRGGRQIFGRDGQMIEGDLLIECLFNGGACFAVVHVRFGAQEFNGFLRRCQMFTVMYVKSGLGLLFQVCFSSLRCPARRGTIPEFLDGAPIVRRNAETGRPVLQPAKTRLVYQTGTVSVAAVT